MNTAGEADAAAIALLETELFSEAAYRRYGVEFRGFDQLRLMARLERYAAQNGLKGISSLQGAMLRHPELARKAFRFASESASAFFTRPDAFMALRCAVLPLLRSATWPVVWLAECSDPAFLHQFVVMLEEEGVLGKTQLFVTNANEDVLSVAAAARIGLDAMPAREALHAKGGGKAPLSSFCEQDADGFFLRAELARRVVWSQHDLAADASFNECHLVVCQRPLPDFDPGLQKRALGLFSESLCNFGILQLEAPAGNPRHELMRDFACLLGEQGIYKRLPEEPRLHAVLPSALRVSARLSPASSGRILRRRIMAEEIIYS